MSEEEKKQHGEEHGEEGHEKEHKGHRGGHHNHGGGHDEHGGVAEWLISFADNVALLMGFFVILLAMNMQKPKMGGLGGDGKQPGGNDDNLMELVYGIREAFHALPRLESKDPKDVPLLEYMNRRSKGQTSTDGSIGLKQSQEAIRPSNYQAPTGSFAFEPYSWSLDSTSKTIGADLGERLRGWNYLIEVRGHTSSIEASGGIAGAMKLSYQRAQAVAELLVQNGLKWQNIRLVACADQERIVALAADHNEHKSNQRVEIIQTNEQVAPDPHVTESR